MKAGWQTSTLGDVCEIYQPKTISAKEMVDDGAYPVFGANGIIGNYDKFNHEESQLLITCRGATCGSVNISEPKSWITGNAMVVRPKDESLDVRFLEYLFRGGLDISQAITGAAQPQITRANLAPLGIAYPVSVEEQQRIVGILDTAFDGIAAAKANAEQNLQNARALFESHLQSVFTQRGEGWDEKTLKELGTLTSSKRIFKSEYVKSGVPFYRTKEVKELANGKEITTELFISEGRYKEIKASFGVPKEGDILLTAIGTIGEIYVVEGDGEFYFKDGNVLWLKNFTTINPHFLRYALVSFVESLNKISHGAAYSALPIQRLNAHKIFVPSPKEQSAIVSQLDFLAAETQRLASLYQRKLAALDELKKSLLYQAFSGAL
ncbi:MAG: restriction endonuclease subunit S [Gallionella sp.]